MKHIATDDAATAWTFDPNAAPPAWVTAKAPREVKALIFMDSHGHDVTCLPGQVVVERTDKEGVETLAVWNPEAFDASFAPD